MKIIVPVIFFLDAFITAQSQPEWLSFSQKSYAIHYTGKDSANLQAYVNLINNGIRTVSNFFSDTFHQKPAVFIYYTRTELDAQWQKDWQMPGFKSECWMVASGVAAKLDMISPVQWKKEACEHDFNDITGTQQLITHELVHVYHGQLNASPDFSDVSGIDWFVEGLATYASGQCDGKRLAEVKLAVAENSFPKTLDGFWTGKLKYGMSGSLVMFIDKKYGRQQLIQLLPFNRKQQILDALSVTEEQLLSDWKNYMLN